MTIAPPAGSGVLASTTERAPGNLVETTVGELSSALKRTIEDRFGLVRVRGEISNFRGAHSSGHAYFCLKDDAARIDAVIWKTAFARLRTRPQEGLEVVATGKVTTFPGKSTYQIVIETLELAGAGALMALLDQRRRTLAAEGLFDDARRRPLPFLPRRIGIVTSPTGAVIRDILHRIADRFPRDVVVWPVRVQGDTAAAEVAAAIDGFNALSGIAAPGMPRRPDLLIVARGGGSLEDLWAFNEEVVVRAAAGGTIPLISAIGHETDTTLLDFVADLRAPTPSGAAEKAVPVRTDLRAAVLDIARRQSGAMLRLGERNRAAFKAVARGLPSPERLVAVPRQRRDRTDARLASCVRGTIDRHRLALARLAHRLAEQAPRARIAQRRRELARLEQSLRFFRERGDERRLQRAVQLRHRLATLAVGLGRDIVRSRSRLDTAADALAGSWQRARVTRVERLTRSVKLLESLGYHQVLARGYALVRDGEGRPLHTARAATLAHALELEFSDGRVKLGIPASKSPRGRVPSKPDQGLLF